MTNNKKEKNKMELIVSASTNQKKYINAPEGIHDAICCDVYYAGFLDSSYQGKTEKKHKVVIVWQLSEKMDDGRPYTISRRYNFGKDPAMLQIFETSTIFKDLKSWFGKAPPTDFALEKLVGQNCQIVVAHNETDGKTYANVENVLKAGKSRLVVTKDYVRKKDQAPKEQPVAVNYSPEGSNVAF
jgi:hypothetical protein